jgi:hypothetical protein
VGYIYIKKKKKKYKVQGETEEGIGEAKMILE